jgi:hypothetical protein
MAKPTSAQWDEIKEKLSRPYGVAYFKCDDYLIQADVRQRKMKLVIQVYVNGWINGKWWWNGKESDIGQMPEIAKRFYFLKKKCPSAKSKAIDIKIFGKKHCRDKGWHEARLFTMPRFNSPGSFIAHLKKHNPSIEVLDYETYTQMLKALPVDQDEKTAAPAAATGEAHA